MKKALSIVITICLLYSCINVFSLSASAKSEKFYENFENYTAEEMENLKQDPSTYDIVANVRFNYPDIDMDELSGLNKTERITVSEEYHRPKNQQIKEKLKMDDCEISWFSPFAEFTYDSLEEYEENRKYLKKISKRDAITSIEVLIFEFSNEGYPPSSYEEIDPYTREEIKEDIGYIDNEYNGNDIKVGVFEKGRIYSNMYTEGKYECDTDFSVLPIDPDNETIDNPEQEIQERDLHANQIMYLLGGVYGLAPNVYIYHSRQDRVTAINYFVSNEVDIINWSEGYPNSSTYDRCCMFVDYIVNLYGIVFVKSAGNIDIDEEKGELLLNDHYVTSPGSSINVICVGSSNQNGVVSIFSRYGESGDVVKTPTLLAPGQYILFPPLNNVISDGTSFSAPIVCAIIAKLMQEFPQMQGNPLLVKAALAEGCSKMVGQSNEYDTQGGVGIINYSNSRICMSTYYYAMMQKPTTAANWDVVFTLNAHVNANTELKVRMYGQVQGENTTPSLLSKRAPVTNYQVQIKNTSGSTVYRSIVCIDGLFINLPAQATATTYTITFTLMGNWNSGATEKLIWYTNVPTVVVN